MKRILFISFLFLILMPCFVPLGWAGGIDDSNAAFSAYDRGDSDEAIWLYTQAIASGDLSQGDLSIAWNNRGLSWYAKGDNDHAIEDYTKAIELYPKYADVYNNLAWLLTICPESKFRDGVKAIDLAKKAVELKGTANHIDTLAAAYAEAGRFHDAIKTEERAIAKLKKEEGTTKDISELFEEHLAYYKAGKPWREK